MRVFVDTSALLALLDADDARHLEAAAAFRVLVEGAELVTSNYVHVEAVAVARRRLGAGAVEVLLDELLPAVETIWVDEKLHRAAVDAYRAGPGGTSLVDQVSFAVMGQSGIEVAFAFDPDFETHGFRRHAMGEHRPPRRLSETPAPYETSYHDQSDLVSVAEIAARSGRSSNTVQSWRRRHRDFPAPEAVLAAGPVWRWPAVQPWIEARSARRAQV